jgi:glycosyltransferase involved in cell wall biosynthesis
MSIRTCYPYVLAVGTLEPRKNLPRLIEAFAGLPPKLRGRFDLRLAGARGWDMAKLEATLERHREFVRPLGFVADADLPALYREATLFCYPSLHEGFGLPVLEALQSGTPVVTSRTSSLPEVGGDAVRYVDQLDVSSIQQALAELLADDFMRRELARRGPVQAARFSWRRTAEETLEEIVSAAETRR